MEKALEKIEGTPFDKSLRDAVLGSPTRGEVKELIGKEEIIVRFDDLSKFSEKFTGKGIRISEEGKRENRIYILKLVSVAKKHFREINSKYGIKLVVDFMLGKNDEGKEGIFTITKRIHGENVNKYRITENNEKKDFISKLEKLYASMSEYLLDSVIENKFFFWDIVDSEQYMYGKKEGDIDNDMYLVDLEARGVSSERTKRDIELILYEAIKLVRSVNRNENRFDLRFNEARKNISELVKYIFAREEFNEDQDNSIKFIRETLKNFDKQQ